MVANKNINADGKKLRDAQLLPPVISVVMQAVAWIEQRDIRGFEAVLFM
ncbi:hypothetical protein [Methylotuvimicrobium sp. KM2]|jgi:hypothetical protein